MSDGCDNLSIDEIAKLTMSIPANDLSSTIIKKALEAGSMDNTSCLIISMNRSPQTEATASDAVALAGGGSSI
jgi:serine/threonine protein phosphatase PrpC